MRPPLSGLKGGGRVVRGSVSAAGVVTAGTGFTVTRTGVGLYTVTFLVPFNAPPVFSGSGRRAAAASAIVEQIAPPTVSILSLATMSGGNAQLDLDFDFHASEQER